MVSEKVRVNNPSGLHLRPAGILCKEAMKYKSLITFQYGQGSANAKSVLSVLGACVKCGDEITLFFTFMPPYCNVVNLILLNHF